MNKDNSIFMTYDEGLNIIKNLQEQIILYNSIKSMDPKEKAILLDGLGAIKFDIENQIRFDSCQHLWHENKITNPRSKNN